MKQIFSNSILMLTCTFLCVMSACSQAQSNDIVAEGETPVRISDSYSFTEGPAADAKGDVFFTRPAQQQRFTVGTANQARLRSSPIRADAPTACTLMPLYEVNSAYMPGFNAMMTVTVVFFRTNL